MHGALESHGFPVPQSERERGFFGPGTRRALQEFQVRAGHSNTGVCEESTLAALGMSTASGTTAAAAQPAVPVDDDGASSPVTSDSMPSARGSRAAKGYDRTFNEIVESIQMPPPPSSVANYLPYRFVGDQLLLSGQAPFFGSTLKYTGRAGDSVSIDDAQAAARLTGLNLLFVAQKALGSLDRVRNVVQVDGLVNCTPDFTQQSAVIDGCSDLMVEVFGPVHGKHVRSAVGQVSLAFDITTEISVTFEIEATDDLADASDASAARGSRGASSGHLQGSATAHVSRGADAIRPQHGDTDGPGGRTVAHTLLDYLSLERVTKLFGIPGGAVVYLLDELSLRSDEFDFVVCRHETGAAYMAHGYAMVTGELGVVLTTTGPGATNALTGAMNAQAANASVLVITGEVPQEYFGQGYLQEGADARLDIGVIYRNAVQYSAIVSSEKNFDTLFEQALRVARSQPPGAAHISLPNNIAGTCLPVLTDAADREAFPRSPARYRVVPKGTDLDEVRLTLDELVQAARPLIFLGNGARQALADPERHARFTHFVEKFAIPVMTTPDGKGIFPESHALSLRSYGMCACTWPDLYMGAPDTPGHYDALVVLGSSLGELATSVLASDRYSSELVPSGSFVHVDLDQGVIGRTFPVTRGIVADIGSTIDAMCELSVGRRADATLTSGRWKAIGELKAEAAPFADPAGRASEASPLHPAAMMRVINEVVDRGHVFIDAGNCVGWSLNNLVVDPPVRYHAALGMGPMGFAVAAVVGGKIGAPDEPCICVTGDGAFLMHGAEVSTAAQHGVGAIWIVLDDNDLAMVSQGMGELFPPARDWKDHYDLGAPDLVTFSKGLGAEAIAVTRDEGPNAFEAALRTALERSRRNRPQVIVAKIDTSVMPPYGWPELSVPLCRERGRS